MPIGSGRFGCGKSVPSRLFSVAIRKSLYLKTQSRPRLPQSEISSGMRALFRRLRGALLSCGTISCASLLRESACCPAPPCGAAAAVVEQGRKDHQHDVDRLAPRIEEQARQQQNEIFALPRYEEIDQQAQRQETL